MDDFFRFYVQVRNEGGNLSDNSASRRSEKLLKVNCDLEQFSGRFRMIVSSLSPSFIRGKAAIEHK